MRHAVAELHAAEREEPEEARRRGTAAALATARHAAAHSPFLRELYEAHGITPESLRHADDLLRVPVLTKQMLREHADRILSEHADLRDVVRGATGGSTGVPTPYYHDTTWWCRATAGAVRGDEWTGFRLGEREASVWGTPLAESRFQRLRRTAGERARNLLFLAGFDLSPAVLSRKLDALYRFRPRLVTAYASLLRVVSEAIIASGRPPLHPRGVISTAEPLTRETRELVERAFGAPVFDRYGSRELGIVAQECSEHDGLHVVSPHVHVEIDVDGRPARPGESGRLLITLLDNHAFPMVRYEVGDLATAAGDAPCPCGIGYPRIARVDGRSMDVLWTSAGGALSGAFFPHLMKEFSWVEAFQVVQDEAGAVEVRVVTAHEPGADDVATVIEPAREMLGSLPVRVTRVRELERTPSGKVRVTQSRYEPEARVAAAATERAR